MPRKSLLEAGSWEKHIHADAQDHLVRLAILHVEFEALHPFHDGNGRLGRMLVPLYMAGKILLSGPMFYISALDRIFSQPVFNSSDFIERSGIPGATARRILRELRSHGVLDVVLEASGRRSAVLAFPKLLNITES